MHYIKYLPISYAHSKMGAVPITDAHCNMGTGVPITYAHCNMGTGVPITDALCNMGISTYSARQIN